MQQKVKDQGRIVSSLKAENANNKENTPPEILKEVKELKRLKLELEVKISIITKVEPFPNLEKIKSE